MLLCMYMVPVCVCIYACSAKLFLSLLMVLYMIIAVCHSTVQQACVTMFFVFRVKGERDVGEPLVSAVTDPVAAFSKLCSLPGILLVVTHHEVLLFDPATLAPLTIVPNAKPLSTPPLSVHDNMIVPSGGSVIARAAVLWVRDLTEGCSEDVQGCEAAIALDTLLIVIRREPRCGVVHHMCVKNGRFSDCMNLMHLFSSAGIAR